MEMTSTGCFPSSTGKTLKVRSLLSVRLWEKWTLSTFAGGPVSEFLGSVTAQQYPSKFQMHGLSDPEIPPPLGKSSYRNTCRHVRWQLFTEMLTAASFIVANNWKQSTPTNQSLINEILVHQYNGKPRSRGKINQRDRTFDSLHLVSKESRLRIDILICLGTQKECWADT